MIRQVALTPSGPGAYTEWTFLVGAPTHWEAAVSDSDMSFVGSATQGQRDSYRVTPQEELKPEDTVLSFDLICWLQWRGSALSGNALVMVFHRIGSVETDDTEFSLPQAEEDPQVRGPVVQMAPIHLDLAVGNFIASPLEFGVRHINSRGVNLHAIRAMLSIEGPKDRFPLVSRPGRSL